MLELGVVDQLRKFYDENPDAKRIFDALARRKNDRSELQVSAIERDTSQEGQSVARRFITDFFWEMEKMSLGRLIVGRRGKQTRLRWAVQMSEVVSAAKGSSSPPSERHNGARVHGDEPPAVSELAHQYPLRRGYVAQIRLPSDLSKPEADRLTRFIQSLAVEN
jgi:hypothetical protein